MARLMQLGAVVLAALVCSPPFLVSAGVEDDLTPYRFLFEETEHTRALLQERELGAGASITCGNGTVARWIRTRCNGNQVEYFMFRNSACSGDPMSISQGDAALAALYQCEKADDSKFGLRYGGYGAYIYGACVDGQVVLEIHGEDGCHDEIKNYVYPSQDCDALCVPAPPIGLGLNTPCFSEKGEAPIPNCTCTLECASCGYSDNPVNVNDCIMCKDGLILYNQIGTETGYCAAPDRTQCFAAPGSDAIPDCTCDPSCTACGYGASPTGPHDCIACQPGLTFHSIFPDGTGYCLDESAPSTCWEDERGGTANPDCQCHPTCTECGFSVMPTGPDQCMGCKPPLGQPNRNPDTGLGVCTPKGLCFASSDDDEPIEGCTCHPDCHSCGYGDSPTEMNNCITCSSWGLGQLFINSSDANADGTGPCSRRVYCYGSEEMRAARKPIKDCACHPDCQACGYDGMPTVQGYDHCIACIDGLYLNEITVNGVGFCSVTPCIMFCVGSMGIRLGPYGKPALFVMAMVFVATAMLVRKLRKPRPAAAAPAKDYGATYGAIASEEAAAEGESLMSGYNVDKL